MGRIVPADRALLERALAGVDRTPAPPAGSYLGELGRALREAVLQAFLRGSRMLHLSRGAFLVLAGLMALAAVLLLVRTLLPRLRRPRRPEPESRLAEALPTGARRDAAAWRAELERRLAAGSAAEALEAAWWWLARSLAGDRADADWTSRDLLAHAPRPELAPLVRALDRLIYGPRRPAVDDVRRLVGRLEEALS